MMTHKILDRGPKDENLKAFRLFEGGETGNISFNNLMWVAKEFGDHMTDGVRKLELYNKFMCHCKTGTGDLTDSIGGAETQTPAVPQISTSLMPKLTGAKGDLRQAQADRTAAQDAITRTSGSPS